MSYGVPPPRRHRLRYYGVLAPNAPLGLAVTALASECVADPAIKSPSDHDEQQGSTSPGRYRARYLLALLLTRIYEAFPLSCPRCSGEMRIIALVTAPAVIRAILAYIGEPTVPPRVARARVDADESIAQ